MERLQYDTMLVTECTNENIKDFFSIEINYFIKKLHGVHCAIPMLLIKSCFINLFT